MELENYKKYRWFFTKSGKLVVGGKSATQNDDLLRFLKRQRKEYVMMHTSTPGSPFSAILSDKDPDQADINEAAVFTGCFSRAWRSGKRRAEIHIFKLSQTKKGKGMKTGTWGVQGEIKKKNVSLELVLAVQEGVLRAVPERSVKKGEVLLKIIPGEINKQQMVPKLALELNDSFSQEAILSALPSGGARIKRG